MGVPSGPGYPPPLVSVAVAKAGGDSAVMVGVTLPGFSVATAVATSVADGSGAFGSGVMVCTTSVGVGDGVISLGSGGVSVGMI